MVTNFGYQIEGGDYKYHQLPFAKKVLTSVYFLVQTRRIVLSGVRGWKTRGLEGHRMV